MKSWSWSVRDFFLADDFSGILRLRSPTSSWLSTYFWFRIMREHVKCWSHIIQLLREIQVYHLLLTNPSRSHWKLSTFNGQTSRTCRYQKLCQPLYPCCTTGTPSLLLHLIIPKHSFTSAKIAQYFVRENDRQLLLTFSTLSAWRPSATTSSLSSSIALSVIMRSLS